MKSQMARVERLEARVSPAQKRKIEFAARLRGTSISDFVISSAQDAAARAIEEHRTTTLLARDSEVFVKALLNPPGSGAQLRQAARRYRKRTGV
ncbi:MAG: DUF1778 domain-containing protein [Bryobacteraceae bacterium]